MNSFHAGGEPGGSSYLTSPIFGIAKTYQNANEQGGSKAASAGGLFHAPAPGRVGNEIRAARNLIHNGLFLPSEVVIAKETSNGIDTHHHSSGAVVWRWRILGPPSGSLVGLRRVIRAARFPTSKLAKELASLYRYTLIAVALICLAHSAKAESGYASYYGGRGHKGEMTCAHRTRPFGSVVTVTYAGHSIHCRINDRGPFVRGRVIDVSLTAARALGMMRSGVVVVLVE